MSDNKKILITGTAGYLGQVLHKELVDKGYEVIGLDNFLYQQIGLENKIVRGDITSLIDIYKLTKGIDTVIALAGIVGDTACLLNEEETVIINQESTKLLVDACEFNNVRRIIFASSCSVYGDSDNNILDENSPLNPVSLYAETKLRSENILVERCKSVSPTILRFGTLYGWAPRMRFDLVANLMTAMGVKEKKILVMGGNQWRPLVHVNDVARAIVAVAEKDNNRVIYNVSSSNYQIKNIAHEISNITKANVVSIEKQTDLRNYRVSVERLVEDYNFFPQVEFKHGIKEIVENLYKIDDYKNDQYYNVKTLEKIKL